LPCSSRPPRRLAGHGTVCRVVVLVVAVHVIVLVVVRVVLEGMHVTLAPAPVPLPVPAPITPNSPPPSACSCLRLTRLSCAPSATATALSESDCKRMACEPPILISVFLFCYLLAVVSGCMPPCERAGMAARHRKLRSYHGLNQHCKVEVSFPRPYLSASSTGSHRGGPMPQFDCAETSAD
jgi:hypothetical protein